MRRFTHTHYDIRMEKVAKDAENAKKGFVRKPITLLPMHPKIVEEMEEKRAIARNAAKTPLEAKREAAARQLPDIKADM